MPSASVTVFATCKLLLALGRITGGDRGALRVVHSDQTAMLSKKGQSPTLRRARLIGHGQHIAAGHPHEFA